LPQRHKVSKEHEENAAKTSIKIRVFVATFILCFVATNARIKDELFLGNAVYQSIFFATKTLKLKASQRIMDPFFFVFPGVLEP